MKHNKEQKKRKKNKKKIKSKYDNIINIKKYKKVLLLSTGSLHNPEMVNQKETIPSITNALTIEVQK